MEPIEIIKNCPFCGGAAQVDEMCYNASYIVGCTKCTCEIEVDGSKRQAIEAWNKRTKHSPKGE